MFETGYDKFKKDIYALTKIDLNAYKEKQMKRRIDNLITKRKMKTYDEYVAALKVNPILFDEFVSYLTDSNSNYLHICGDKVYFDHNKEDHARYESGLYCYSLKDDEFKLVFEFEDEINCLNSYNDKLYIATDEGIFTLDGKITDRSAKSIYLLDEDWIYAVENEKGNVYRVSLDGKTVEKIGF